MKRGFLLFIIITISIFGTGCGNEIAESESAMTEQQEYNVQINVPKEVLEGFGDTDYAKAAEDIGLKADIKGDGAIVYTMTVSQQEYMLRQMEGSIQSTWDKIRDRDNSNIESIDSNKAYTVVTVVSNGEIKDKDEVLQLICNSCRYRQIIAGEGESLGLSLKIKDKNTGEITEKLAY